MKDPYAVLEVPSDASADAIRRSYRRLAHTWHPDKNADPAAAERFREIAAAWAILSDPAKRRSHDLRAGRTGTSGLDEPFVDAVAAAIERAQDYLERVVLPHYASRLRGRGAEMAAEWVRDLGPLADPAWLTPRTTWLGRRRARQWSATIAVAWGERPYDVTELVQHRRGFVIRVSPLALWSAGFRTPSEIDDAVLRLLLARYAQIVSWRRYVPSSADPGVGVALARAVDDEEVRRARTWTAIWTGVGLLIAVLLYSGWTNA